MAITSLESLFGLLVISLLALIAVRMGVLDFSGLLMSVFIGYVILISGGPDWLSIVFIFFIASTLSTKFRSEVKNSMGVAQKNKGIRGWSNTLANGGVAAVMAVMSYYTGQDIYLIGFLGALSTATADTLATEIGQGIRGKPRLLTEPKKTIDVGTSGGITIVGELASLLGALIIGLSAVVLTIINISSFVLIEIVLLSGFLGSNLDSFLGASIQSRNACTVCGKYTEHLIHHGKKTKRIKGIWIIENNLVNLISTFSGALIAILLFIQFS